VAKPEKTKLSVGARPVTLSDIAQACGLARSTVSSALSGTGTISPKTREKARRAAKELGYRPNLHAATLANFNARSADASKSLMHFSVLLSGDNAAASHWFDQDWITREVIRNQRIIISTRSLDERKSMRRLSDELYHQGVQGIILSRMLEKPDMSGFDWSLFSVVQEGGRCLAEWPFDQVRHCPATRMRFLLNSALERGYRRPGCVLYRHRVAVDDDELRLGEALAFNARNIRGNAVPPLEDSFDIFKDKKNYVEHRRRLFDWYQKRRPDCIVSFNSAPYFALKRCEANIDQKCGFLVYSLRPREASDKRFFGFFAEHYHVAQEALERLRFLVTRSIKGVPERRKVILVESDFNEGSTLPPKRAFEA